MEEYVCVCGKVCDNSQKFNGHRSQCKVYLLQKYGSEDYIKTRHNNISASAKRYAVATAEDRARTKATKQQAKLLSWLSTNPICENCGKAMTAYYGSGRFCSEACARSFTTKDRRAEINAHISAKLKQKSNHTVSCIYCGASIVVGISRYLENCVCSSCLNLQQELHRKNKIGVREQLAVSIKLSESPYNEFDTAYLNTNDIDGKYYYLVKHNDYNAIIKRNKVPIYRYNIEMELHRQLKADEVIHHIDGNHFNNDRSNLIVLTNSVHSKLHGGSLTLEEILANHLYIYK